MSEEEKTMAEETPSEVEETKEEEAADESEGGTEDEQSQFARRVTKMSCSMLCAA